MNTVEFQEIPLTDCHIHYGHHSFRTGLEQILEREHIHQFNIVCTPDQRRLSLVPDALHLKAHFPERCFVFGGLDISPLFTNPQKCGEGFASYLDTLVEMGCDGLKMIEGKPMMRKMLPIPDFDSPAYAPFWQKLSDLKLPLLFHVNDPEEFWIPDKAPDWAFERGWFYGDGTFVNNEDQYSQILNVLDRHPDLTIIFAHFFFLSRQLARLEKIFDRFPNVYVDLVPGVEMYRNFALNPDRSREFFIKHQDRILFGTDIGAKALLSTPEMGIEPGESHSRVELIRSFLETDGPYTLKSDTGFLFGSSDTPFQGINLPEQLLRKIYFTNFLNIAGSKPAALNPGAIIGECTRLEHTILASGAAQPGEQPDTSSAAFVRDFFINFAANTEEQ